MFGIQENIHGNNYKANVIFIFAKNEKVNRLISFFDC